MFFLFFIENSRLWFGFRLDFIGFCCEMNKNDFPRGITIIS